MLPVGPLVALSTAVTTIGQIHKCSNPNIFNNGCWWAFVVSSSLLRVDLVGFGDISEGSEDFWWVFSLWVWMGVDGC